MYSGFLSASREILFICETVLLNNNTSIYQIIVFFKVVYNKKGSQLHVLYF
jgi:hypothetical protein